MGGKAFAATLSTPRMPGRVYREVREQSLKTLRKIYRYVDSPVEAPGKVDYGDVDILVAEPIVDVTTETLAEILRAKEVIQTKGSPTTNFAIPWPARLKDEDSECEPSSLLPTTDKLTTSSQSDSSADEAATTDERFIQLDLHVCESYQSMQWELFQEAHGDFWNVIGGMIRRFGLVVSNSGFYLKIKELEGYSKNLAKVLLTLDASMVLNFFGLDAERFSQSFNSLDKMMAYASSCRFHDPSRGADKDKNRAELKANDRQRIQKRQAFAYWIDEYLPTHRDDEPGAFAYKTRDEVVEETKIFFGKEVAETYDQMKRDGLRTWGIEKLWAGLRKDLILLSDSLEIGYIMKGLKREIATGGEDTGDFDTERQAYKDGDFDVVRSWAEKNWKEVGKRQKDQDRRLSSARLREKMLRVEGEEAEERPEKMGGVSDDGGDET